MYGEDISDKLKEALLKEISCLEPASPEAADDGACRYITFDGTQQDNLCWKELIKAHLAAANTFELHCWEDEEAAIALGLKFGSMQPTAWKGGVIIAGEVTEEFSDMLLSLPLPPNIGFTRLNPFFSVVLDSGLSSEHYGRENIIRL